MGVAILMNGGPATMYGPSAYRAFQDFTAARTPDHNATHVHQGQHAPASG